MPVRNVEGAGGNAPPAIDVAAMYAGTQLCPTERYMREKVRAKRGTYDQAPDANAITQRLMKLKRGFGSEAAARLEATVVRFRKSGAYDCPSFDDVLLDAVDVSAARGSAFANLRADLATAARLTHNLRRAMAQSAPATATEAEVFKVITKAVNDDGFAVTIRSKFNALLPSSAIGPSVQGETGRDPHLGVFPN